MNKSVYIVGPTFGIERNFEDYGYRCYTDSDINDVVPDLVSFMGGVDIDPKLYGEDPISETQRPNRQRDAKEIAAYHKYAGIPKLGVCRGAQLLNVLNGGSLYQHVDGHEYGRHPIRDIFGKTVVSSSIHHQMMRPAPNSKIIAWSAPLSSIRKTADKIYKNRDDEDVEILWIEKKRELLIQGHPEFGPPEFTDYTMKLIDKLIWENE